VRCPRGERQATTLVARVAWLVGAADADRVTEPPVVLLSGKIEFGGSYDESTPEIIPRAPGRGVPGVGIARTGPERGPLVSLRGTPHNTH
jgi:hypothetical protein